MSNPKAIIAAALDYAHIFAYYHEQVSKHWSFSDRRRWTSLIGEDAICAELDASLRRLYEAAGIATEATRNTASEAVVNHLDGDPLNFDRQNLRIVPQDDDEPR